LNEFFTVLVVLVVGAAAGQLVVWLYRKGTAVGTDESSAAAEWDDEDDYDEDDDDDRERLEQVASHLDDTYGSADSQRLPMDEQFRTEVARLADPEVDVGAVVRLARDDNAYIACMALTALARREDVPADWTRWAIRALRRVPSDLEPSLYAALAVHAYRPVIGQALALLDEGVNWQYLARFIRDRRAHGESVSAETFQRDVPVQLADTVASFVEQFEDELGEGFRAAFDEWRRTTVDLDFISRVGRVWERPFDEPPALLVGRRRELVELIVGALTQKPPRSVLLVGEHGVGKTAVARAALDRLEPEWVVFEATAAQVNAGAVYIGELEGRIKQITDQLKGHTAVWVFPALEEALYAGQHTRSPHGMLDALLPNVDAGDVTLLAETTPTAFERLQALRPHVASAFEVVRVRPLPAAEAVSVAQHALEHDPFDVTATEDVLQEATELADQFLPGIATPGSLLRLVKATAAETAEAGGTSFDVGDVLATLAAAFGLPLAMLDPQVALDLDEVRAFFASRVLGQREAVECVVERIAMIKAGLTDPTRPLGVFLLVGPTGTGKTEIAKALAEFLFGSRNRLVRLDMSEFQTPESLDRLLADSSIEAQAAPLISSVRKDPFAVVLLDEFEKSAAPVWDVFLQVFDDGRLTDRQGREVDFRRAVIVLTSNVGSAIARDGGVGFVTSDAFSSGDVEKAVKRTFRPEFLNRIDRLVVFRPFERGQMRALLDKELADALVRRGLRGRPWAIEIDDSAYEFIIEQGFSPQLGARPLKRAVERYLLTPLAAAIVEKAVPEGDQFLFVTAPTGERIDVTFVDPDAGEPAEAPLDHEPEADEAAALDLRALALSPRDDERAGRFLLDELRRVSTAIRGDELQDRKQHALAAIGEPGFWDDEDRFVTLADAEYLDRLQAALATAESLGQRLARRLRSNGHGGARDLVGLLSTRLYVLDSALIGIADDVPADVFVRIRASGDESAEEGSAFVELLAGMYAAWSERRGMRVHVLDDGPGERLLSATGLGCGEILRRESGVHTLERVEPREAGGQTVERVSALVHVAPWQPGPQTDRAGLLHRARTALEQEPLTMAVVRRYRPEPAPLVRDAVRGYRTGRLDRVLDGDFDLF
jgi:ATP-dependent Clp protease ATP-binding subunit ClpC